MQRVDIELTFIKTYTAIILTIEGQLLQIYNYCLSSILLSSFFLYGKNTSTTYNFMKIVALQ